jgi:hypothetical protein
MRSALKLSQRSLKLARRAKMMRRTKSPWRATIHPRLLNPCPSALQKCNEDEDSSLSSVEGSSHFQDAMEMLEEHHPNVVLALKSRKFTNLDLRNVLLLDN